jgi:hypothetical protein
MNWLAQNWIWIVFAAAFVAMHAFGHGGHGRHADHGSDESASRDSRAVPAGRPEASSLVTPADARGTRHH